MSTFVGKKFPDVTVKAIDEMGDAFQINVLQQAVENKKKVVLFWYPKDFTFVCPTEIHAFKNLRLNLQKEIPSLSVLLVTRLKYTLLG